MGVIVLNDDTEKFVIKGRGTVLFIDPDDYSSVGFMIGMKVSFESVDYTVSGVEESWTLMSPPKRNGKIGLIVRRLKDGE